MTNRPCVLVADDDPDEIFLLRWAFKRAGLTHELRDLSDGAAIVEYLNGAPPFDDRVRYPFPNLLLVDLKMPRMNGFDVLRWLQSPPHLKHVPAVVLSSSDFEADVQLAGKLGAREFLTKPSDLGDWVTLAQVLHQRWLAGHSQLATVSSGAIQGHGLVASVRP